MGRRSVQISKRSISSLKMELPPFDSKMELPQFDLKPTSPLTSPKGQSTPRRTLAIFFAPLLALVKKKNK
jgi:hypothetical protein